MQDYIIIMLYYEIIINMSELRAASLGKEDIIITFTILNNGNIVS